MSQETETVEQVCGFFHNRLSMSVGHWSPFLECRHNHGDEDGLVVYILKTFEEFSTRVDAANRREIIADIKMANYHIIGLEDKIASLKSLVKELADKLDEFHAWEETRALVAKAREACK